MIYKTKPYTIRIILVCIFILILSLSYVIGRFVFFVIAPIIVIIFINTLVRRNDLFGILMALYICVHFPYMIRTGGFFTYVAFVIALWAFFKSKNLRTFYKLKLPSFPKLFLIILLTSSVIGWFLYFSGSVLDLILSVLSFLGIISLFILASNIEWNNWRFKVFFNINLVLILYSLLVSANAYLRIIPVNLPLFPIYAEEWIDELLTEGRLEAGGIIGNSPMYGEHSMIMAMFFSIILITKKLRQNLDISFPWALIGFIASILNVFFSISRSIFLLCIFGLILIWLFNIMFNLKTVLLKPGRIITFAIALYIIIRVAEGLGLGFVFQRLDQIDFKNITLKSIQSGESINRATAFYYGQQRLNSRNWLIGYGYGLEKNNRIAWFIDPDIERASPHSQYFAILFIFGWFGAIAYFGLIVYLIIVLSKKIRKQKHRSDYFQPMALFFIVAFILFLISEYTKDAIAVASYFTVTMIWLGLGYSLLKKENTFMGNYSNSKVIY